MNDRIKELIQQMEWEEVGADLYGKTFDGCMTGEALQKFAELIVRECGNIVSGLIVPETPEQDIGPYEKWNQALGHAALEIEQHFFGDAHK